VKASMLLLIVLFLLTGVLFADIHQYYSFEHSQQPYTPINGTPVSNVVGDDHISNPVDIGFTFPYGINSYTQVKLSSNGYITLDNAIGDTHFNDLSSLLYCPVLAPLWDDTWLAGLALILLTGSAPNRVFTIQYSSMKWPYYLASSFNYQVKMYETGQIDFCYGTAQGNPQYGNASIGINMLPGGSGNFLSITPGAYPTASSTSSNNLINAFPAEGTVYSFIPAGLPAHDLAAVSINGSSTPVQNIVNHYIITISNHGYVQESNYTVDLMEGTTVLAILNGPVILPNETLELTIDWTPVTSGIHVLHGRVNAYIDEVADNNETDCLNVAVLPQTPTSVTVGDGTQFSVLPMNLWSFTSISETLYLADEIGMFGSISALAWYNSYWSDVPNMHVMIWMGTTDLESMTSTWINSTQLSLVFDGNVNFPSGQNVICIPLDTPFNYDSGNLVVMFFRPWNPVYYSQQDQFHSQMGTIYRSLMEFSSTVEINPAAPPNQYGPSRVIPQTTFHFGTVGIEPTEPEVISSCLQAGYPNPFSQQITIPYDMRENQNVTISIYNLKGQHVRTVVNAKKTRGRHSVIWDGKDKYGKKVCSGVYTCRMQLKDYSETQKMLLMK